MAADIADTTWKAGAGNTKGSRRMEQHADISLNATERKVLSCALGAHAAVLEALQVGSVDCANLDVCIKSAITAGGRRLIYGNDALVATTIDGVVYSQYLNRNPDTPAIVDGDGYVYVILKNNDGVARTAFVDLYWRDAK